MKIVIVGAGFTGIQLAKRLIAEKNDVALIESDEEIISHTANRLDCMIIQAAGNSLETLEEAGIAKADALVVLTSSDEVNMITCSLADAVYPQVLKIARVRNYEYYVNTRDTLRRHEAAFLADNHRPLYGIDYMVHPDVEAAEAIISAVEHGAVIDVLEFDDSEYVMTRLSVQAGSALAGAQVMDVRKITDEVCLISYIETDGTAALPSGQTRIRAGDVLGLLTKQESIAAFLTLCGSEARQIKKIALVGAGRVGTIVAERLLNKNKRNAPSKGTIVSRFFKMSAAKASVFNRKFAIIDKDAERAKTASERFPGVSIFRADITDEAFVDEERIADYDLVICATHNHELNMVVSGYLKSLGVEKTISLVASGEFAGIARKIGSDVAVPLKDAVIDTILGRLRGKSVTGIHTVSDGDLEIIECELPENAPVAGKALKDIAVPGSFLILQVRKKAEASFTIPMGGTVLNAGDHIIVIVNAEGRERLSEKFGGSL